MPVFSLVLTLFTFPRLETVCTKTETDGIRDDVDVAKRIAKSKETREYRMKMQVESRAVKEMIAHAVRLGIEQNFGAPVAIKSESPRSEFAAFIADYIRVDGVEGLTPASKRSAYTRLQKLKNQPRCKPQHLPSLIEASQDTSERGRQVEPEVEEEDAAAEKPAQPDPGVRVGCSGCRVTTFQTTPSPRGQRQSEAIHVFLNDLLSW